MANSRKKHQKFNEIIKLIAKIILDIIPLLITILMSLEFKYNVYAQIYNDCISNGSLIWIGCIYVAISLVESSNDRKKHEVFAGILFILNILILCMDYALYLLLKISVLNESLTMDYKFTNGFVWAGFLGAFACYFMSTIEKVLR